MLFTSLDHLSPSALESSWFCGCLDLTRCCHSATHVLVQNRSKVWNKTCNQNIHLIPLLPVPPKIINLTFPFHPFLLFLTHSVSWFSVAWPGITGFSGQFECIFFFFFFLLRTNYLCHSLSVSKESIWVRWWMTQSLNQSSHAQPLCSWVPRKKAVWISSILNQQLQLHRLRDHESQGRKGLPEVSVFFSPSVSYYSLLPCPSVQFPEHSLPVMQSSCEDRYCTCRWLSRALTASSLSFSPPEGIKTTASK